MATLVAEVARCQPEDRPRDPTDDDFITSVADSAHRAPSTGHHVIPAGMPDSDSDSAILPTSRRDDGEIVTSARHPPPPLPETSVPAHILDDAPDVDMDFSSDDEDDEDGAASGLDPEANSAGAPPAKKSKQQQQQQQQQQQKNKKKKGQRFYCKDYPPCNLSFTRSEHLARHIRSVLHSFPPVHRTRFIR